MAKDKNTPKSAGQPQDARCQPLHEVTVYDWMRKQNCKSSKYQHAEAYPNIRPPVSRCDQKKTKEWMSDTMEATGCERIIEMPKDGVMDAWTRSPKKETLACYGVNAGVHDPEAVLFNQALAKSLLVASGVKPKPPKQRKKPPKKQSKLERKPKVQPSGAYVLNRECLRWKLERMPTVRRKLSPRYAFTWLHCPPRDPRRPFEDIRGSSIPLTSALGMDRTPRKHLSCDQPKKKKVSKEDLRAIDVAFRMEQEATQLSTEEEPKNYDDLYSRLISCFEQSPEHNDMCQELEKCCKKPGDPPTQGCGEMVPEFGDGRAGVGDGDGGSDDGGKDADGKDGDGNRKGDGGKYGGGKYGAGKSGAGKYGAGKDGDGKDGDGKHGDGKHGDGKHRDGKHGDGDGKGDGGKDGVGKDGGGKDGKGREDGMEHRKQTEGTQGVEHVGDETEGEDDHSLGDESGGKKKNKSDGKKKNKGEGKKKKKKKAVAEDTIEPKVTKVVPKGPPKVFVKDCPCEVCDYCDKKEPPDSPLIREMRRRDKERQQREYLMQMRHRQYLECRAAEYRAPQHKCEPIVCCQNPLLQDHLSMIDAVQQLQTLFLRCNRNDCDSSQQINKSLEKLKLNLCSRSPCIS